MVRAPDEMPRPLAGAAQRDARHRRRGEIETVRGIDVQEILKPRGLHVGRENAPVVLCPRQRHGLQHDLQRLCADVVDERCAKDAVSSDRMLDCSSQRARVD